MLTSYPDIDELLSELLSNMKLVLGAKLVGLYLEGSLVLGDFDPQTSDIDLLAVLSSDVNGSDYELLNRMHQDFVVKHPFWNDRIEVCYISALALQNVKSMTSPIVNISPGEPFHRTQSNKEWLMNWYLTREKSKPLFGPSADTLIEPISQAEFIQSVKDHTKSWDQWLRTIPKNKYALSYVVLTLCRALYSSRTGDQVSKKQAAEWAQKELPEWSDLIREALIWKQTGKAVEPDETNFARIEKFVTHIRKIILES